MVMISRLIETIWHSVVALFKNRLGVYNVLNIFSGNRR